MLRLDRETEQLRQKVRGHHALAGPVVRPDHRRCCAERGYLDGERGHRRRPAARPDLVGVGSAGRGMHPGRRVGDAHPAGAGRRGVGADLTSRAGTTAAPCGCPDGPVREALAATVRLWAGLESAEHEHRLELTREPDLGFAWPAYRWARGESLDHVLAAAEVGGAELSAGDFVRWCKQLLDLLEQIAVVAGPEHPVGRAAASAIKELRRGVVGAGA